MNALWLVATVACAVTLGASAQETNLPVPTAAPPALVSWERIKAKWSTLPLTEVQAVAGKGDPTAQHYLGRYHLEGLGGTTNHVDGLAWYRKAAGQGFANAQNNLGVAYLQGIGVKADAQEALRWFRLAAQQGFPDAQRNLASALTSGVVTRERRNEAREWLEKAARSGNADAQIQLARFLLHPPGGGSVESANALYWYKKAFAQGRIDVCSNIGWLYADGFLGDEDPEEAIDWFQRGMEKGDSYCELSMGWMYSRGRGVKQDLAEGKKWMRQAVDKGNLGAHFELGKLYELRGVSTPSNERPDYAAAAALYRKGADAGDINCGLRLAQLYFEHRAEAKSEEAVAWVRRAADKDNKDALVFLANLYAKGQAQPRHPGEAPVELYRKLARWGYAGGYLELARRYRNGDGVPKDLILAAYLYMEAASRSDDTDSAPEAFAVFQLLDDEDRPRPQNDKATTEFAREVATFRRAVEKGDQATQLEIARRYLNGEGGLPRSEFEAYVWFSFAAAQGAQGAGEQAAELRARLTEVQLSDGKRRLESLPFRQGWLRQNR